MVRRPPPPGSDGRVAGPRDAATAGFSLVEVTIVMALIGTLAALGVPAYLDQQERARVARSAIDIAEMSLDIERFQRANGRYPNDLGEAGLATRADPWGGTYRYLKIGGAGKKPTNARKDRFLVPLNSDFDLYSVGPDGSTAAPLNPPVSHDDVLRANNGGWVGLGADY